MTTATPVVVVKLGSSSLTDPLGSVDVGLIGTISSEIASLRMQGLRVVVVSSGAIAAGWSVLGAARPSERETAVLQAVSAVGQPRLIAAWAQEMAACGMVAAQVLLAPLDFAQRQQYLHARSTLANLLALDVVPVVNENDVVADDEIRFGDNDRLAALVAHLVGAQRLVMLTDAPGLLTADPRRVSDASLIEEVLEIDRHLETRAGGPGSPVGSGGMASKLAAAKIATWSGVETVIADARRPGVLSAVLATEPGAGTVFRARRRTLSARKLWIAFAVGSSGTVVIDDGARRALMDDGRSLLAAGVRSIAGDFERDEAVEVVDSVGVVVAKGLVRCPSSRASEWVGKRSSDLPRDLEGELIHRDDLVVLGPPTG
ncbi:MAG: glutamate 5-kinase [Acidimicrobiales bacterium]